MYATGAGHCFDRIDDQIDHYLLQVDPIGQDEGNGGREAALQSDGVALQLALGQSHGLADYLIDVQPVPARRQFAYEGTDAADNLARSSAVPNDTTRAPDALPPDPVVARRASANPHWRW